jgi:cytochrome bd ubiquinol oxidase subunit I
MILTMLDVLLLSRIQFALTVSFHYIYPPLSIGLGLIMVISELMFLITKKEIYYQILRFWVKIFALTFAIGVATGIVMEFEFGTNWATYSKYVGDVFGSALAAEGIFAFFLESGFLAILLFGWNKVGPKMHFFSTCMVALGAMFSAVWIVVANSWQQTPTGFQIVGEGLNARAEITDFWAMVFNPSSVDRLIHVLMGSWQAGAWLVISVAAYYLLINKHKEFAMKSIQIALVIALVSGFGQLLSGHSSAVYVSKYQPVKLAAFEGHFEESAPGDLSLFGWIDEKEEVLKYKIAIPKMLSFMLYGDFDKPVRGLKSFPVEERPPLNIVFQTYHIMIAIGFGLIALSLLLLVAFRYKSLFENKIFLLTLVLSVLGPQIANQAGWYTAEIGRQPWIVYNLLKTSQGLSERVTAEMVLGSLIMFTLIYFVLFILFIYLLDKKIKAGPEDLHVKEGIRA